MSAQWGDIAAAVNTPKLNHPTAETEDIPLHLLTPVFIPPLIRD